MKVTISDKINIETPCTLWCSITYLSFSYELPTSFEVYLEQCNKLQQLKEMCYWPVTFIATAISFVRFNWLVLKKVNSQSKTLFRDLYHYGRRSFQKCFMCKPQSSLPLVSTRIQLNYFVYKLLYIFHMYCFENKKIKKPLNPFLFYSA